MTGEQKLPDANSFYKLGARRRAFFVGALIEEFALADRKIGAQAY